MSERDFVFWLQGFLEMTDAKALDEKQLQTIKDHIKQVVTKVTPNRFSTVPYLPSLDTTVIC